MTQQTDKTYFKTQCQKCEVLLVVPESDRNDWDHYLCQTCASPRLGHKMRTASELHKIKKAFALAMLDLLDVYDELLATGRIYVADDLDKETNNAKYE